MAVQERTKREVQQMLKEGKVTHLSIYEGHGNPTELDVRSLEFGDWFIWVDVPNEDSLYALDLEHVSKLVITYETENGADKSEVRITDAAQGTKCSKPKMTPEEALALDRKKKRTGVKVILGGIAVLLVLGALIHASKDSSAGNNQIGQASESNQTVVTSSMVG